MLNKVVEMKIISPYKLHVRFKDGSEGTHDLATMLASKQGPVLDPLRDETFFARAFLDHGAPTWPNGFDMCPDWLHMTMAEAGELDRQSAAE